MTPVRSCLFCAGWRQDTWKRRTGPLEWRGSLVIYDLFILTAIGWEQSRQTIIELMKSLPGVWRQSLSHTEVLNCLSRFQDTPRIDCILGALSVLSTAKKEDVWFLAWEAWGDTHPSPSLWNILKWNSGMIESRASSMKRGWWAPVLQAGSCFDFWESAGP